MFVIRSLYSYFFHYQGGQYNALSSDERAQAVSGSFYVRNVNRFFFILYYTYNNSFSTYRPVFFSLSITQLIYSTLFSCTSRQDVQCLVVYISSKGGKKGRQWEKGISLILIMFMFSSLSSTVPRANQPLRD